MDSGKQREGFASRLGFILVSAGCAIGIGNVWRFPTVTGQNGGGVFVLFYLLFLVLMGVPVLTMELAVGRAGHNSAVKAYKALEPKGTKWHLHGWVCMIGCALLMMYYTTPLPRCSVMRWPTPASRCFGWWSSPCWASSSARRVCRAVWSASANG